MTETVTTAAAVTMTATATASISHASSASASATTSAAAIEMKKVDWSKSAFFGRSKELQLLSMTFDKAIAGTSGEDEEPSQVPAAFLWGVSGTGKSHLVQHFIAQQEQPFYYLKGKHDEYTGSSDPLGSIIQAMNDLIEQVGSRSSNTADNDHDNDRIRQLLETQLGDDMDVLCEMLPSLSALVGTTQLGATASTRTRTTTRRATTTDNNNNTNTNTNTNTNNNNNNNEFADTAWNRLQYVFGKFIKTIATEQMPVVMFLDDLQWAPKATLDLLASVLQDPSVRHFFLLGTIRQEYGNADTILPPTDALSTFFDKLAQNSMDNDAEQIYLSELTEMDTNVWLSQVLEREDTAPLTAKIYEKTNGNIFFTMQTVHELQHKGALYYINDQWEWKQDIITLDLCNDIVDSVALQLQHLPTNVKRVLTTAAYIRSRFDIDTLFSIWKILDHPDQTPTRKSLLKALERAVLEGLLTNQIGGTVYQFAHDRIQQAAYEMVPAGSERNEFRFIVGRKLLKMCNVDAHENDSSLQQLDDGLVFVAADHFNSHPNKDHLYVTQLNLEIGDRALRVAALVSASKYFGIAHDAFQKMRNGWTDHYDLALRLYQTRACAEISLGNYDVGHPLCNKILETATTLDDKLPSYLALSASYGRQEKSEESLAAGREALELLGEYPKRGYLFRAAKTLIPSKAYFKKHTDDEILELPLKTDSRKKVAMKFFTQSSIRAYGTGRTVEFLLSIGKSLQTTIKDGLCPESAMGIATLGMVVAMTGDQTTGVRFGALAVKVLDRTHDKTHGGWVYFAANAFINAFSQNNAEVVANLWEGHELGMKAGDFEIALLSGLASNFVAFFSGKDLPTLAKSGKSGVEAMERFKTHQVRRMGVTFLFLLEALTGKVPLEDKDLKLGKEEMIEQQQLTIEKSDLYYHLMYHWARMQLCTYLRHYEWADNHAKRLWKVASFENAYYFLMPRIFFAGLAASGRYHQTKNKKYLKKLRKMANELKKLVKLRGMNSFHRSLLLEALVVAAQGSKPSVVKRKFVTSILIATNAGYVQDAALGHELAGEHFLRTNKHEHIGDFFTKAVQLYKDWGCSIKVEHILKRRLVYINSRVADGLVQDKQTDDGEGFGFILAGPKAFGDFASPSVHTSMFDSSILSQGGTGTIFSNGTKAFDDMHNTEDDNLSVLTDGS